MLIGNRLLQRIYAVVERRLGVCLKTLLNALHCLHLSRFLAPIFIISLLFDLWFFSCQVANLNLTLPSLHKAYIVFMLWAAHIKDHCVFTLSIPLTLNLVKPSTFFIRPNNGSTIVFLFRSCSFQLLTLASSLYIDTISSYSCLFASIILPDFTLLHSYL